MVAWGDEAKCVVETVVNMLLYIDVHIPMYDNTYILTYA